MSEMAQALTMLGSRLPTGIQKYPSGRYANAHAHMAARVLVSLKGKGYTLSWPKELGMRPWEAGQGHLVKRQDYVAGGIDSSSLQNSAPQTNLDT